MKKYVYAFIFAVTLFTCKDSPEQTPSVLGLTKNVGGQISLADAERWAARYKSTTKNAKTQNAYSISASTLRVFLNDLGEYVGLHFKHSVDESGRYHIVVTPERTADSQTVVAIDANEDSYLNLTLATAWAERYAQENPNEVRSHFFGSMVFQSIVSRSDFERLEIIPGVNDAGAPQLLLFAWNTSGGSSGRQKGQSVDVYDMSNPCPTYCAQ